METKYYNSLSVWLDWLREERISIHSSMFL